MRCIRLYGLVCIHGVDVVASDDEARSFYQSFRFERSRKGYVATEIPGFPVNPEFSGL